MSSRRVSILGLMPSSEWAMDRSISLSLSRLNLSMALMMNGLADHLITRDRTTGLTRPSMVLSEELCS